MTPQEIKDLASYTARTNRLTDKDRLALAAELISDVDDPATDDVVSTINEMILARE